MKVIQKSFTAKLWTLMKIGVVQGMIAMMIGGMAVAHGNYGQVLDKEVTIRLQGVSFEAALREIEVAAQIKFVYSADQLKEEGEVSLEGGRRSLGDVLNELLTPRHIQYKVHDKEGAITLRKQRQKEKDRSLLDEPAKSENPSPFMQVTGKVTDATTQQPVAGVNVVVKGTTIGTTTDAEGTYAINADGGSILVFSFIGYTSVEMKIDAQTVIDIALQEDVKNLSEVVVNAGYYTTTKETQTGNIVKIEAKDIAKQPVSNPLAALQGRVAGLEVTQSTGVPGGNFKVRIRGTNSIANGNDPLYIVDGVPYTSNTLAFNETSAGILGNALNPSGGSSPLNSINPSDIESIEVLKDADATAIYGSRGSNGVILITTKKGKAGKTKVDFNFYAGGSSVASKLNEMKTTEYLQMRREAFANDEEIPTPSNARDLAVWDTTRYTDWQRELIGNTASIMDAQFSISGGDQNTQFSVGGGYHRETTVFPGDNSAQRISTKFSISNVSPNQRLKTIASVNFSNNGTDLLNQDLTNQALYLPPNAPALYDESGNLNWEGWDPSGGYENPVAYKKRKYEATTDALIGSLEISYLILPSLTLKTRLGHTNTTMDAVTTIPVSSMAPEVAAISVNSSNFSSSNFRNWIVEPQANWNGSIGPGKIDVLAGTQFLDQRREGLAQTASGFSSEALMKNLASAPIRGLGTNIYAQYRYQAVFGRINYAFQDKYIINITGRRDGSSRFGPGKQFANFGAVGAAWLFSKENFIKSALPFLSFGKLRGSYGITGNDQLTDYQYLDAYTSSAGPYQGTVGLTPVRLSNPDFAWETNRKIEGAIDLSFVDNRIATSFSYYRNRSSNQLVGYPLPPTTGFNSIQANFPATVENTGLEIELTTQNIRGKRLSWSTSLNLSIPRNKLVEFSNLESTPDYASTYVVGKPLNIFKLYHYTGVDPASGLYTFQDINGDGVFDEADRQTIRFVGPEFFGGLYNSVQFGGFQLDIMFQFVKQTGRNYLLIAGPPGSMVNQPIFVSDRWRTSGDQAEVQRYSQSPAAAETFYLLQGSDRLVTDASFIRLKNLSFSYSLPALWMDKMHATQGRLFIQTQNLLTFTHYIGLDPETQGNYLPPLKTVTCGFNLTF